ncbi:MAG: GAF domain-containing protein, partial [Rhodospirillales bacterium]|nr:GAF domain-containing protein [Rhodospirillales bacterium]
MSKIGDRGRQIEALRERLSTLTPATRRISASLDVDTVLREIAEAARALTGARYAVITTVDATGQLEDAVLCGFSPEEERQVVAWGDALRVFEALRDLPAPVRVADMRGYVAGLGFSTDGVIIDTFQGTPMHHRRQHVGNFFLGQKETGPAFTDEDEEVMALFASQAATAIANARVHRDERRARSDLEALIEISPVGVLVFDARTGHPVSFNREVRRILEGLRTAGCAVEELLEVITVRRADGREFSLSESPLAELLSTGETVHAEEIELSVPDGRSVSVLLNAASIHAEEDEVVSVVVTMQDLAPLQELERLRAEFLGLVSHELRAPLTSIKGSASTLLEESAELDPAERREFYRIIHEQAGQMRGLIGDLLDAGRIEAGTLSVAPEPSEVAALVDRARSTFVSGGARHDVLIALPGDLPP